MGLESIFDYFKMMRKVKGMALIFIQGQRRKLAPQNNKRKPVDKNKMASLFKSKAVLAQYKR